MQRCWRSPAQSPTCQVPTRTLEFSRAGRASSKAAPQLRNSSPPSPRATSLSAIDRIQRRDRLCWIAPRPENKPEQPRQLPSRQWCLRQRLRLTQTHIAARRQLRDRPSTTPIAKIGWSERQNRRRPQPVQSRVAWQAEADAHAVEGRPECSHDRRDRGVVEPDLTDPRRPIARPDLGPAPMLTSQHRRTALPGTGGCVGGARRIGSWLTAPRSTT